MNWQREYYCRNCTSTRLSTYLHIIWCTGTTSGSPTYRPYLPTVPTYRPYLPTVPTSLPTVPTIGIKRRGGRKVWIKETKGSEVKRWCLFLVTRAHVLLVLLYYCISSTWGKIDYAPCIFSREDDAEQMSWSRTHPRLQNEKRRLSRGYWTDFKRKHTGLWVVFASSL